MTEYIEQDVFIAELNREIDDEEALYDAIERSDEDDVVKVVRCKDCKWYQEGKLLAPNKFCFRLKHPKEDRKIGYNYAPDDFCSYGERRKENEIE